jgi:hypothetical protein
MQSNLHLFIFLRKFFYRWLFSLLRWAFWILIMLFIHPKILENNQFCVCTNLSPLIKIYERLYRNQRIISSPHQQITAAWREEITTQPSKVQFWSPCSSDPSHQIYLKSASQNSMLKSKKFKIAKFDSYKHTQQSSPLVRKQLS